MTQHTNKNAIQLRDNLAKLLDLDGVRSLCFDLGIDFDNLAGTTKNAKIEALIKYCARYGYLSALLKRCHELNPNYPWPQVSSDDIINYSQIYAPLEPALSPEQQAKRKKQQILLQKVKDFWIRDVLEHSTRQGMLINLEEKQESSALEQPWEKQYPTEIQANLQNLNVYDIFAQAHNALLILGQPGAGKTTTLLALAQDLAAVAESEPLQPIPVVLTLVSWGNRRQSLLNWIVEELKTKYQIPEKFGRQWLEDDDLILLLDGLDEVSLKYRPNCVAAINQFRDEHGLTGIAVTSREDDYASLNVKLKLDTAVNIQPLTNEQIDTYLKSYGTGTEGLRQAIHIDKTMNRLAQSPLMLKVMCIVYGDRDDLPEILSATDTWSGLKRIPLREALFVTYVSRIFEQQTTKPAYSKEITRNHLSWLAIQMKNHNQTVFQLDQIQPSWLPTQNKRTLYLLLTRSFWGLVVGLFMWLFDPAYLSTLIILPNLIVGLGLGVFQVVTFESHLAAKESDPRSPRLLWQEALILGLIAVGLITGGGFFLSSELGEAITLGVALYFGLLNGVVTAISAYYFFGSSYRDDIHVAEALSWSWKGALKGFFPGVIIGLVLGIVGKSALDEFDLNRILLLGLETGVLLSLYGGLQSRRLETHVSSIQALRSALRNGLLAAGIFGLVYGGVISVFWGISLGIPRAVQFGIGAGLMYGGFNILKYVLLRILLIFTGQISSTYKHFLDFSVEINLLRQVGGGYIFIHRLLLEHFVTTGKQSGY